MNQRRNNRGVAELAAIWACMALAASIAAFSLRHSHRERKAVTMCVAAGESQAACEAAVAGMSRAEIVDYIRDDGPGGNQGNFVGGYAN